MPNFACPKCKKVLKTAAPLPAGKKVKCPACSQIFPVPAEASAEQTAVQAGKPVAPARPAAPPVQAAKRTRPDAEAAERASIAARKAKARAAVDDEDEEEEERPARRRKKKGGSKNRLVLILSGVGVLLLLVVAAAFIWPGFLRSTPTKSNQRAVARQTHVAGQKDLLAYVPASTDLVVGADLAFLRNKPEVRQQFENGLRQQGATAEHIEILNSVDRGILAMGGFGKRVRNVMAFNMLNPVDSEKMRTAFHAGPAQTIEGKAVSLIPAPDGKSNDYLAMPQEKTVVVGSMAQADFVTVLDGNGKLAADMESLVNELRQKSLWAVVNLQAVVKEKAKEVDSLNMVPEGAQAMPALKNAKLAAFSIDWDKGAKLQLDILCANEQDASQIESSAKAAWEKYGKPKLSDEATRLTKQPGSEALSLLAFETSTGLHIERQGAKVSATLAVGEGALKGLDKIWPSAGSNPQPTNPRLVNPRNRQRPLPNKKT